MIYVTGDVHGSPERRLSTSVFYEQKHLTKDDYVVICGDFGCIWDNRISSREMYILDWLDDKPFTTLFVDGNHENHNRLDQMDVHDWHGGKVHFLRPSVLHLMRGQYFEDVSGMSIFSFGGARSHDIDHLLDPADKDFRQEKRYLDRCGIFYRVKGKTWWEREMPDDNEKEQGKTVLKEHGNKVDLIVTHEAPQSLFSHYYRNDPAVANKKDPLRDYLEELHRVVDYRYWIFGHHHDNHMFSKKDIMLYEQIIGIF